MSTKYYQKRQAESALKSFYNSNMETIFKAYKSPSKAKQKAFYHCVNTCAKYNGYNLRVISKNTNFFTCGFLFMDENKTEYFYYITSCYETIIKA